MNRYVENIAIKYKLLLLFSALFAIAALVINSYRLLQLQYARRKKLPKFLALLGAVVVADVVLTVLLLKGVFPDIWIPQDAGRRMTVLLKTIVGSGFLPHKEYLTENLRELTKLNAYANAALIGGGVALLNFIFVHNGHNNLT